jgi:hypothetical protein
VAGSSAERDGGSSQFRCEFVLVTNLLAVAPEAL